MCCDLPDQVHSLGHFNAYALCQMYHVCVIKYMYIYMWCPTLVRACVNLDKFGKSSKLAPCTMWSYISIWGFKKHL